MGTQIIRNGLAIEQRSYELVFVQTAEQPYVTPLVVFCDPAALRGHFDGGPAAEGWAAELSELELAELGLQMLDNTALWDGFAAAASMELAKLYPADSAVRQRAAAARSCAEGERHAVPG